MKLYELPCNTYFSIQDDPNQTVYLFEKVDGMYSRCFLGDKLYHFAAWTDVNVVRPVKTFAGGQPNYTPLPV